jgi:hypothetical protein
MTERQKVRSLNKGSGSVSPGDAVNATLPPEAGLALGDTDTNSDGLFDIDDVVERTSGSALWLPPSLAFIAFAAWTGFYGWAMRAEFAALNAAPGAWAAMVAEWAVPVLLIGVVWLIAMRHSRAEASRFAASAALLRRESEALEDRLKTVNRELSLAREFLGSQSQELDSLGRIAAERISHHAAELQALIRHNGNEVAAIATTSQTALGNMNLLRDNLPVVANSARDAANQIGNAGRGAQEQVEKLIGAFDRLNQFGTASAGQVQNLGAKVEAALTGFEEQINRIEDFANQRFVQLQTDAEAYGSQIDKLETQALGALKERARRAASEAEAFAAKLQESDEAAQVRLKDAFAELHYELLEKLRLVDEVDRATAAAADERMAQLHAEIDQLNNQIDARTRQSEELIEQRQAAFETREAQASEVLAQRLAELDDALAQRREIQIAETEKLVVHGNAMAAQIDHLGALIDRVSEASAGVHADLAQGLGSLGEQLDAKRVVITDTQTQLATLTDAGVRLLEIIQSGARFTREDLASSIAAASEQLGGIQDKASTVQGLMLQSTEQGEQLDAYLIETREQISGAGAAIRELEATLASQSEDALAKLQGLRGGFARLAEESGALAEGSQEQLREALSEIEQAIAATIASLDQAARGTLGELAQTLGSETVAALERALRNEAAATVGKLEQAASHASGIGREATVQLRDQLAMVNELTGNLEQRIARARELAEEQINNDFARRMALITDSLNSAAIDITSALSTEVPDTAWEAYLKGDRGIFTRRAIRLIDNGTAREIADMYQRDEVFKGNVSRYIHDFEAMLRSMLSTRNGNVLSVTMLGSDMGKLYVALAQAIQRFRS